MYLRCVVLIVCVTVIAACLLAIRQQRVELTNEMASLHRQTVRSHYEIWRLQGEVAGQTNPRRLHESIARANLDLEPMTAEAAPRPEKQRTMLASRTARPNPQP